jgi:hypothetical protein
MRLDTIKTSNVNAKEKHRTLHSDARNNLSNGEITKHILRAVTLVMPGHGTSTSRWRAIGFELQVDYSRR